MQARVEFSELLVRPDFDQYKTPTSAPPLPDSCKRVIIVSNVLPVRLKKSETGEWSGEFDRESNFADGPLLVGLKSMRVKVVYVGVPNINVPIADRPQVESILAGMNCYPVYVTAKEASLHFQGVCKSVLWPCFHSIIDCYNDTDIESILGANEEYVPRTSTPKSHEDVTGQWQACKSYNPLEIDKCWPSHLEMMTKARRVVVGIYGQGDVIWVHDYHEIMLVGMLRRALPSAPLGLFVHTPFASSEVFRCLSKRSDLLDSMLQADHVGFHSFEYARHFLSIAHRMYGLKYGARRGGTFGLETSKGRTVVVSCAHAGLDVDAISAWLASPALEHLRQQCPLPADLDKRVVVGIDEVEGLRGIPLKLLAFDRLLANVPSLRNGALVLKQFGLVLDSRPDDYRRCHDEVVALVKQINQRWGPVVEFIEGPGLDLQSRLALYEASDVLLQTSVRWGLCTEPLEYRLAHRRFAEQAAAGQPSRGGRGPGMCVVSEFVACARVLPGSLRVNPWSADEVAKALEQALAMGQPERVARCFRDVSFLDTTSVQSWGETMLRDLIEAAAHTNADVLGYMNEAKGALVSAGQSIRELDEHRMLEAFAKSASRLVVLDYSGTLVETTPHDVYLKPGGQPRSWHYAEGGEAMQHEGGCLETRDAVPAKVGVEAAAHGTDPAEKTVAALKRLCKDCHVVVMTMDLKEELEFAMKELEGKCWLLAENGYACKAPGGKEWRKLITDADADDSWRPQVKALTQTYVQRCNGSFCFVGPSSVSFNYMLADPELGEHCAASLRLELNKLLETRRVVMEQQKGALTVRLAGVNRGAALTSLASHLPDSPDFIAVFGDDAEDEAAFQAALDCKQERTFTVKVGTARSGPTAAEFSLHDPEELTELLTSLGQVEKSSASTGLVRSSTFERMALVTKQSLIDDKPRPAWKQQQVTSPSVGVVTDLAPAPMEIPKKVQVGKSKPLPSSSPQPPPPLLPSPMAPATSTKSAPPPPAAANNTWTAVAGGFAIGMAVGALVTSSRRWR